jgi:transposase
VFIDESAALTNLVRSHGRSPRGQRAHGRVPCGKWHRLTVIGALGVEGLVGAMSIEAATNGAVFAAFLERVLLPELKRSKPDAVIVMDNLGAHKTRAVRELLEWSGFAYRSLPPYSPDLNPIEPAWAKVKADLRRAAARSVGALHEAVGAALDSITARDAAGCFRHAGYAGV